MRIADCNLKCPLVCQRSLADFGASWGRGPFGMLWVKALYPIDNHRQLLTDLTCCRIISSACGTWLNRSSSTLPPRLPNSSVSPNAPSLGTRSAV